MKMFKNTGKSQKGPWIPPPGRSRKSEKGPLRPIQENISYLPSTSHRSRKLDDDDLEDVSFCSSTSSKENPEEFNICLRNIKQEHRVLSLYFMSLRPISLFLNRYFSNTNIQDVSLKKLLSKIEEELNNLLSLFDDLEYSISLFENTSVEDRNNEQFSKVVKLKENLLLKVLGCYTDILTLFQVALEDQSSHDTKQLTKERDSFVKQLEALETKSLTQASKIKDLERRLSILQGKYSAIESYNSTLEETKAELQKIVHLKDLQIKNLTSEINQVSLNHDNEKLIEIIEELKTKSQAEKTALKKALKVQKIKVQEKDQLLKKLEEDINEKTKMLFELANQRDKLKVQMTVAHNQAIEAKYHIEEIKSQKLKLQNELSENKMSFKNELYEETETLKKQLNETKETNAQMEKTIKQLEIELNTTTMELQALKSSEANMKTILSQVQSKDNDDKTHEEVRNLISLLQDTKEHLLNIKTGIVNKEDNILTDTNYNTQSILSVIQDIKNQLSELKKPGSHIVHNTIASEEDYRNQLEDLKNANKILLEENTALKTQIEKLKNTSSNVEHVPKFENYPASNMETNFSTKNLQVELMLKTDEIWRIRQREKKLESQLEEVKDKLQKKEMENCRLFSLEESLKMNEEELKSKKMEISLLEQKKLEESERLLNRTKELQEALDEVTSNYESLQRYVDMLKSSLYNVFGDS